MNEDRGGPGNLARTTAAPNRAVAAQSLVSAATTDGGRITLSIT